MGDLRLKLRVRIGPGGCKRLIRGDGPSRIAGLLVDWAQAL